MTDKTESKEREDVDLSRACVKAWNLSGFTSNPMDAVHPMFSAAFELGYRASLAASAGSEPVAQLAVERDELLQAAIDFIRTLTGMEPPPIEVAPPEVFAPFHAFVNTVQAITNKRQNPPRDGVARPCHVFNVRKAGPRTEWTPTTMALALPDGEHALYTHPSPLSPPEGMVGGWVSVEERLPPPFEEVVVYPRPDDYCCEAFCDTAGNWKWAEYEHNFGVHHRACHVEYWLMLPEVPAPPTSSADSRKGE